MWCCLKREKDGPQDYRKTIQVSSTNLSSLSACLRRRQREVLNIRLLEEKTRMGVRCKRKSVDKPWIRKVP